MSVSRKPIHEFFVNSCIFMVWGVVSAIVLNTQALKLFFMSPLLYIAVAIPFIILASFLLYKIVPRSMKKRGVFFLFTLGMLPSPVVYIYFAESLTSLFLIFSAVFFIMFIYGYIARVNLLSLGALILMGSLLFVSVVIVGSLLNYSEFLYTLGFVQVVALPIAVKMYS